MRILLVIFIVFLSTSCSGHDNSQLAKIEKHKELWSEQSSAGNYSFLYKRYCKCEYSGKSVVIRVKEKKLKAVTLGNRKLDSSTFPTIDQIFEIAKDAVQSRSTNSNLDISVKLNRAFGYPEEISIGRKQSHDSDIRILVSNVEFQ